MSFPVVEKFVSINGESIRAGEPAVFIRFRGCNLNCSYCDTAWANSRDAAAQELTAEEITDYADSTGITDVTLTGGEPMLQSGLGELTEMLMAHGHRVEIETNGSISIKELSSSERRPSFTLDYKLPGSGMETAMLTENYEDLCESDAVKFVVSGRDDLGRAKQIIEKYGLADRCRVYLSPVFGRIEPAEMVSFMLENKLCNVRLQLQLHKYIWDPDKKGV